MDKRTTQPEHKPIVVAPDLTNRFWQHTDKSNSENACWNWTHHRYRDGRGRLYAGDGYEVLAPRYSWALHFGTDPSALMVCHRCDNPSCVNPKHLFLGTAKDNLVDASRKGRLKMSPARRAAVSERTRERWVTIGFRRDDVWKERVAAAIAARTPEKRAAIAAAISTRNKKRMEDPKAREEAAQYGARAWEDPAFVERKKAEARATMKALWAEPEFRAKRMRPFCPHGHDKEGLTYCRICAREKKRLRDARKRELRGETPEQTRLRVRESQSERSRRLWSDPEWRDRLLATRAARHSPKPCSVEACDGSAAARGFCNAHYYHWKKSGTASGPIRRYRKKENAT